MTRIPEPAWCQTGSHPWMSPQNGNTPPACPHCRPTPLKAQKIRDDIDRQQARDEHRHLQSADQLAHRVKQVSRAQTAGDIHALRQALIEVASAAECWATVLPTPRDIRNHAPHFDLAQAA